MNIFFIENHWWLLLEYVFFGLPSVIFIVFVADFEHVFVFWERHRMTIIVLQILEIPYPANKYSKLTKETLKQYVKSVKS